MASKSELARVYIAALDLHLVAVFCRGERSRLSIDGRGVSSRAHCAGEFFFARGDHAQFIGDRCIARLSASKLIRAGGWIAAKPDYVAALIARAAAELGVRYEAAERIEANVKMAIAHVDTRIEAMRQAGGLAAINAGYKRYRLQQASVAEPAMAYGARLAKFKLGFLQLLAQHARLVAGAEFGDLTSIISARRGRDVGVVLPSNFVQQFITSTLHSAG